MSFANNTKPLTMKRNLLILALALGSADVHAQMGWRLPRVQQYFDQRGERQHFDPTRAQGIFQGRIFYSFHTAAYDVRVGFDADGTVGFIGWMKTEEDDGDNPTAKFTEPEVDRLLTFASNVEWRRGPDTLGNSNDLFGATWIGYFRGKPTFKGKIQNGAHAVVYQELYIDTFR
jgi:hypothetical protein